MRSIDGIEKTLLEHADEAEVIGTLPEPSWRALHEAGLFLLKSPEAAGGIEADPILQIEVIERIASIDTSAGWTAMIGSGSLAVVSAWLPDAGLEEILVDGRLPRVAGGVMPNGVATKVAGGYRLSGRWQFGSGSAHAQWFLGNGFVQSGERKLPTLFVFPRSEARVHADSWNVRALRGTGSYDISVTDIFVPEHRTADIFGPALRGGAFFKIAVPGFVALDHGAFALGAARRTLAEVAQLAKSKSRGYLNPVGVSARGAFQGELGRCDLALRAARSQLIDANAAAWRQVNDEGACDVATQTGLRCAAVYATEVAMQVTRCMFRHAGARSLFAGNVVERCQRDVTAAAQHVMVCDAAYERRGQVLLGFPNVAPMD